MEPIIITEKNIRPTIAAKHNVVISTEDVNSRFASHEPIVSTRIIISSYESLTPYIYQLTVTNNGDEIPSGSSIVVQDVNFPSPPLTITSILGTDWSCTSSIPGQCTYTGSYPVAANAALPPITVNVAVDSGYAGGTVNNCAEVTLQQAGPPVLQDNSCADVLI